MKSQVKSIDPRSFRDQFAQFRHELYSALEWRYIESRKAYLRGPDGWYWAPAPLELAPQDIEDPVEGRILRRKLEAFTRSWEDLRDGPYAPAMRKMNKIYRDLKQ